jgi:hypothetical protein
MGGNGWWQTGPYEPDLAVAFRRAQELELAEDDHGFTGMTVEELWRDESWMEYVLTGGTGTVLDQAVLTEATDSEEGPFVRPLTDREIRAWVPGGRPTEAEWEDALDSGRLEFPDRALARCTVLYRDGVPDAVGYWGVTAD